MTFCLLVKTIYRDIRANIREHFTTEGITDGSYESERASLSSLSTQTSPTKTFHALQNLPGEIFDKIAKELDDVSRACLSLTCTQFRHRVRPGQKSNTCAQWMVFCRLEKDYFAKPHAFPKKFACAFCKKRHHWEEFERPNDIGGEYIYMLYCPMPTLRFCTKHFWKRIYHEPPTCDKGDVSSNSTQERWLSGWEQACGHCRFWLAHDTATGQLRCQFCDTRCETCGYVYQFFYARYGPKRPLRNIDDIKFVRRRRDGYQ